MTEAAAAPQLGEMFAYDQNAYTFPLASYHDLRAVSAIFKRRRKDRSKPNKPSN